MDLIHIIAVLLSLIAVVPAVTLGSPIRVERRAVPTIMIIAALGLWFLPTGLTIAIGLVPVAAWISARVGIEHAGHDPADMSPAVNQAKAAACAVKDRVRKTAPVPIQQFVTHGYPSPGGPEAATLHSDAGDMPDDHDDDPGGAAAATDATEPKAAPDTVHDRLAALAADPSLPAGAPQRLGGGLQRPGLRTGMVRSFVPSL